MQMILLVLHRKERYAGEFLPEVVACVDEVTLDENPEWWAAEKAKQRGKYDDPTVAAWAEVEIEVPTDAIMAALYPKTEKISAEVKSTS